MTPAHRPEDCVCFNTRKLARLLGQVYDRALEPSGLKNTQFTALAVAQEHAGISITELARAMEIERTTLTRNLQLLKRDGLVELAPGADGRSKAVVLTGKGRRKLQAAMPLWASAQQQVLRTFGGRRWTSLQSELEAMRASLHE